MVSISAWGLLTTQILNPPDMNSVGKMAKMESAGLPCFLHQEEIHYVSEQGGDDNKFWLENDN